MNIVQAIADENLLRPFLAGRDGSLKSWRRWRGALEALYGLPNTQPAIVARCTGRPAKSLPAEGFDAALFLTGRRSGKSKIAATVATFEAAISGRHECIDPGEVGLVAVLSPTRYQSRIVKDYIRGAFDSSSLLKSQIKAETKDGFTLRNDVRIEILAGDWRTIRGYSLLAAIVDEVCFFGVEDESKVRSDTELIRAIQPSLATTGGKLIAISSPYARRGWSYAQWERCFGNPEASTLVWNAASLVMNPSLSKAVVDRALAEDVQAARSEYLGEWRDDVASFVSRDVVDACVKKGRTELLSMPGNRYLGFVDVSGGRGDDATLAIAHRDKRKTVIDSVRRWKPPFSPYVVVGQMASHLAAYGIRRVTGDAYAAEFVSRAFEEQGIRYLKSPKPKGDLYAELLPMICSGEIELLDYEPLIVQLCGLERRTRSGGKDIIDHPRGGHDDVANAVAGVAANFAVKPTLIGALP